MVLLILILSILICIFFGVKFNKKYNSYKEYNNEFELTKMAWYAVLAIVAGIISIAMCVWMFQLITIVGTGYTIDEKIAMYSAENSSIEKSLETTVKNYMAYETETYEKFKNEDAISLISLFPNLKSDKLVKQQIKVYISNNKKIKELKEEKINLSKEKFKLYFGR